MKLAQPISSMVTVCKVYMYEYTPQVCSTIGNHSVTDCRKQMWVDGIALTSPHMQQQRVFCTMSSLACQMGHACGTQKTQCKTARKQERNQSRTVTATYWQFVWNNAGNGDCTAAHTAHRASYMKPACDFKSHKQKTVPVVSKTQF